MSVWVCVCYVFFYVREKVRQLWKSWTMADQLQNNSSRILLCGGGCMLDIRQTQFPSVFSFLCLLFLHPHLYLCCFHPPPPLFLHHLFLNPLLPLFLTQSQWILSCWPLLVTWPLRYALRTASHSSLCCPVRSNLICSHTYRVGKNISPKWGVYMGVFVLTVCCRCCWGHTDPRPSIASWSWELGDRRRCMWESGCCHSGKDSKVLPPLSHESVEELGKRRANQSIDSASHNTSCHYSATQYKGQTTWFSTGNFYMLMRQLGRWEYVQKVMFINKLIT